MQLACRGHRCPPGSAGHRRGQRAWASTPTTSAATANPAAALLVIRPESSRTRFIRRILREDRQVH